MNKKRLIGVLVCFVLLFTQIKAYSDSGYQTKSLNIGDNTEVEDATNVQTFKKEEIPSNNAQISGSVNSTAYTPTNTIYVPYYNNYPTTYYAYPTTTYIYRTGVPYYTYGTPSYRISQPAYINGLGYGAASSMSYNYKGHAFNYNIGAGTGMYASRPVPYNPPPPPPPSPCCRHHQPGQMHPQPRNLPSNVVYRR